MMYRTNLLRSAMLLGLMAGSTSALACDSAEKFRLSDEISSLANRGAWGGVERKYQELLDTKCDLKAKIHSLGAESARNLGKTLEMLQRLTNSNTVKSDVGLTDQIREIENVYGRVEIRGDARKRAPLIREVMPFAPDERKSVEYAISVMEGTGSFKGMLPVGEYKVLDKVFTVKPNTTAFLEVVVGKGNAGQKAKSGVTDAGLINWIGPVVMIGPVGFMGSAAPPDAIYKEEIGAEDLITAGPQVGETGNTGVYTCPDNDGNPQPDRERTIDGIHGCVPTVWQPSNIGLFNTYTPEITLGGEIGLTYRSPEMGIIATVTYRRLTGNSLNQLSVFGGAVIRPGRFRFTAGPTWGILFGEGTGLADWVDQGQPKNVNRQQTIKYAGHSMGGGATASAGMGIMDIGPFEGVVELHGHWQTDLVRSYQGFGIRLGIVPKVKRFEG